MLVKPNCESDDFVGRPRILLQKTLVIFSESLNIVVINQILSIKNPSYSIPSAMHDYLFAKHTCIG